jgi:eukaryotic-like serine/threonine-protein kinase
MLPSTPGNLTSPSIDFIIIRMDTGERFKTIQCPNCNASNSENSSFCNKCGASLEKEQGTLSYSRIQEYEKGDPIHFSPGANFGDRYIIIEEIGRGGMGRVYKAEDSKLGLTVALKMIRPEYSLSPSAIERFKKEILLARSITHENVVRIYDLGEVNEVKFISMEYIKGQNLRELIHTSGNLTVETTLNVSTQLGEALRAAHKRGIIHQDLKSSNILIDNNGKVFITDFGLAKSIETEKATRPGAIIGTPAYFSPEQAKGEKADQRSDIYSLGIIIYEMLIGKLPFHSETNDGYIQKHIHERPVPPSKINPAVPQALDKIILRCLEKDRDKRYQSVEELIKDLQENVRKFGPFLARAKTKRTLGFIAAAALIIVVAIGVYLSTRGKKSAEPFPSEGRRISLAVMYFINTTGDKNLDHWRESLSYQVIQALLQSKYIRVLTWDRLLDILEQLKLQDEQRYSWEDLKKVALRGGVNHILHGNYSKAGDTFRINALLRDANTGEVIAPETVEGVGEKSMISMVDQLAARIKANLKLSKEEIASDYEKEVGKIITGSPEAMKDYMEGLRCYNKGKFSESIQVLAKAVALDPGFALAYKIMAENYQALGDFDQAKKYIQTALSLVDRVSERERFLIQGDYSSFFDVSNKNAFDNYKRLLELYPDDEDGNIYLGALYRELEEWDLAKDYFEKVLKVNDTYDIIYANLAYVFMARGLYEKARDILLAGQNKIPDSAILHQYLFVVSLAQGRLDLASLELEKASSLAPDDYQNIQLAGNLYQIEGNWSEARKAYQQLLEKDDPDAQNLGQFRICHLDLTQGKYEQCKKGILLGLKQARTSGRKKHELNLTLLLAYLELQLKRFAEAVLASNQAIAVASEINFIEEKMLALNYRGLAYIGTNDSNGAEETAAELRQCIAETEAPKFLRYYNYLMGAIAKEKGLGSQAIDSFDRGLSLLSYQHTSFDENAFFLDSSASAYYINGDLEKAQERYQNIISLTTGRLTWGDLYARSFYWLGKIYQKKGVREKAIEHYEKFLQLWNKADPGLSETKDAQKQLAALRTAGPE